MTDSSYYLVDQAGLDKILWDFSHGRSTRQEAPIARVTKKHSKSLPSSRTLTLRPVAMAIVSALGSKNPDQAVSASAAFPTGFFHQGPALESHRQANAIPDPKAVIWKFIQRFQEATHG